MISPTPLLGLTISELERLVKEVEPAAFLVPARLLRRVIKQHRQIGGIGLLVPHRKGYVIDREALLECVEPGELGLAPTTELPPFAYLMVRSEADRLAKYRVGDALVKHWRILFHLRIDHAMQQKLANGSLTANMVRMRLSRLGLTEFAEVTAVMRQEDYLLPPESAETIYAEFVAVYLTLRRFDPARLSHFFPALRDLAAVDALVAEDIDADAIFKATRLAGAPEPGALAPRITQADGLLGSSPQILPRAPTPAVVAPAMLATAEEKDADGNAVRAAILRVRAGAAPDLGRLSARLQNLLRLSGADAENWRAAMLPLLTQAARSAWGQEARLLYDLQNACVDNEHGIYTVDLVEWAMSLGQLPIKRQLPGHQDVVIVRHLRRAMNRLRHVSIQDAERERLAQLLGHGVEHRERLLRERFRPLIAAALDDVGLKPSNVVEGIGRAKLIEELLDRVVEFGHLNIGNLRDAISRNQLKLPDLKSPVEFVLGDPLIRLNRRLAVDLDGVYRRGEFYMRLLHRLSSAAFGTGFGRLLVLFLILPFGLAFFVMITPEIAIEEGEKLIGWVGHLTGLVEKPPEVQGRVQHEFPLPNWWGVAGLGVFFLLLFHVGGFRRWFFNALGMVGHGLYSGIVLLMHSPALQAILHNRFWSPFRRLIFWPALAATAGYLIASWWEGLDTATSAWVATGCLLLTIGLLNTRLGRAVEETIVDRLLRFWFWVSIDFVPGLLHLIMDVSRWCLEGVEQVLYTVNEWLRFRSGENRAVVVVKAVLGLGVFCVTYVLRFAINLLIEPQINPIKHFPVVTVAHKVCLPMIPTLAGVLRNTFAIRRSTTTATGIIFGIPGIFGFMVWELKENWKLYATNRADNLKPVLIGSHGETMLRLLRPGFHSATIPKLYKRLRRAERRGQQRTVRIIKAALRHVIESVEHFIEREMLALLRQSKGWGGLPIELGHLRLATNRVLVELRCPSLGESPLVFAFDQQTGWLLAGMLEPGWLPQLNPAQRQILAMALAGLYKMAGVHLTREQIAASLPRVTGSFAFVITDDGLTVWTAANGSSLLDLGAGSSSVLPVLDASRLLFTNVPLTWHDWMRTWQADHAGDSFRPLDVAVLPATNAPSDS